MKATGGPQKLRFTVVSFSGEDADYPINELLFHSPQTRGWQTPRFCKYPQEVVLKLEQPSKVQQIQILSHEYKVATKIEVFVASPAAGEDVSRAPFRRLGYLSFDSNDRSHHQARELKSVHVSVQALYIRLLVHRCHVNKLNIYNQVGIIALNLIGEPERGAPAVPPGGYLQLHPPITRDVTYYNQAAADVADLNLDIHVDTVTAAKIRELARAKDAAVANEDYDEAKKLKASIDRLKVVGQKIAQLEARKRAAVEKEDYDTAKLIKADIDKLRSAGDAAAIASDTFAPRPSRNAGDVINRVMKNAPQVPLDDQPVKGMQQEASLGQEASVVTLEEVPGGDGNNSYADGDLAQESSFQGRNSAGGGYSGLNKHLAYDERPAMGKGRYTPTEEQMAAGGTRGGAAGGAPAESDIPPPSGWPADLPAPEPLAGATAKDAEPVVELGGEYCARAAFSKNWQLREAAVNYLLGQIKDGSLVDRHGAFRTIINLVKRAMKDKVANVYLSSLSAFQQVIDGFASHVSPKDVQGACETCLPLLLEKLGDTNARLREASKESIMFIAGLREAGGLKGSTHVLVKPIKNQNAWRLVLGVLSVLQELVPLIGIGKAGSEGFDLSELMEFLGKAYNNSNVDVRSTAVKVTREVHDLVGPAIRKYLPKDLNPKMKEQLDEVLGQDAGPPAAAPPPAAAATRAAPAGRGAAATKAPAARGKSAAAPALGKVAQAMVAAPAPPPPPAAAPDDPRPFEAELKQRESTLGPNHPDVAESCSNLATLYNQKGETTRAMPLYERALAIYEAHYGPNHPEVAHTLTDLAVLHLEQGQDTVGRPLLERALAIQEKALGPDHPDVLAIKDVLNSE